MEGPAKWMGWELDGMGERRGGEVGDTNHTYAWNVKRREYGREAWRVQG